MLGALNALNSLVLAGINWHVTIRGVAVVAVGTAVLMGSIWLILATNIGSRVGTLVALSGFFGWMVIMGIIWWIFGIGWQGAVPSWHTVDINRGDLSQAAVAKARDLPNKPLAQGTPYDLVLASGSETLVKDYGSDIPPDRLVDPNTAKTPEERRLIEADNKKRAEDWQTKNRTVTLAELAAVDRQAINDAVAAGKIDFGGWRLLSTAQSGEAVASASAALVTANVFPDAAAFKVLDSFDVGGKDRLPPDPGRWDRIWLKIKNTARITHPTRYAIVQVQAVQEQKPEVGEAPPRPVVDPNQPIVSVIMKRDLGDKRFKPAMTTVASLLLFGATAFMAHSRDKLAMAHRAANKKN